MKKLLLILAGLTLLASACSSKKSGTTLDNIPKYKGYVNDFENIFTDAEEKTLDSLITAFEKETSVEIAVVTLDTTMVGPTSDDMYAITFEIANTWGVGKKEKDSGVLIGISKSRRLLRIQNGLGTEKVMSDMQTKEIVDHYFIPNFKEGRYFTGTYEGLKQIMNHLRPYYKQ
ncbi:MAG TPA: TPM domain-containing protein [Bacteroidia bacterium]|nr:TPM domain-containing protein [Bacteroidia bacterium]